MYECETCTRTFYTQRACHQHMNDTSHWPPVFGCETCTRDFGSQHAANQHMNALGHWQPKVPCETCGMKFHTESAAEQHMRVKGHYKHYCGDCGIRFGNQNNLKMHLHSKTHQGSNVSCPFCQTKYTTASGVAHHLERGSCPRAPNLNRESILREIRTRDPRGVIVNKQIAWHEDADTSTTYLATDHAFNGRCWECYICHANFKSRTALNSHLNSPVHKQKVYHCPNTRGRCAGQFSTLAALFSHLESESCAFIRFDSVQRQVGGVLQGSRLISF
ncbi:hypothetical protein ACJ73_09909 [Blastomyces percursus]|uniref:C2H2-type domain-containing protein n=1 Tax=Blastomyces percursus TaxID=1658174 RepID=A0A1J9Q1P6_9EURO|nr:hypothetical protein ACJ73_09909 [Blastomyces percursus]